MRPWRVGELRRAQKYEYSNGESRKDGVSRASRRSQSRVRVFEESRRRTSRGVDKVVARKLESNYPYSACQAIVRYRASRGSGECRLED